MTKFLLSAAFIASVVLPALAEQVSALSEKAEPFVATADETTALAVLGGTAALTLLVASDSEPSRVTRTALNF
ncbi:hypothetical protein Q4577_15160 [Marinovum sp. 2_MG-2023]|uniref:hypothetical protein n=1 Tax=unclassified Marinovum TaxID=2647166 RepID=UPI0026E2EC78|nr:MULTISPECIES: hypothetical protein [unclassified Marinovum]MDO6731370.1 hypothetical protein [Marinovum sp. 2_MG-2023]MDO6780731.1 hypothetical protein [Marinovum sp. 1_MG-2023]